MYAAMAQWVLSYLWEATAATYDETEILNRVRFGMAPLITLSGLIRRRKDWVDLSVWLSIDWFFLFGALVVFIISLPFLLSRYVLIVPNEMDETLVALIGRDLVKPVLFLLVVLGGILGLVLTNSYRSFLSELSVRGRCVLSPRQAASILAPMLGMTTQPLYTALSYLFPPSYAWGPLLNMFVVLPAAGYMLVSAAGWLALRYWTEREARKKIRFYRLVKERAFVLELVDQRLRRL